MKVGMIGIGDIAKKAYLPILTQMKGIELHVCTRSVEILTEIAATYRLDHTYHNLNDWIECGMEAAFVHSATESHERIIDVLLDNDIHVYVDKPITYYEESSKRLIEKAKQKGLILMVGFNRRYAPPIQKLKEITEPNMVLAQKNRGNQAEDTRTFIFDDFIHVIDTLLYLFPYPIDYYHIRGKSENGKLHHVVLQLEAKQGTSIGIMNRESGTSLEKVDVFSAKGIKTAINVNEVTIHKDKDIITYGNDNWQPTLYKRGFYSIVQAFLDLVKNENVTELNYREDLKRHMVAELVCQRLKELG